MKTVLHRAIGATLALTALGAIVWASNASITVHGSNDGVLRLAWSARPERIEVCREQSEAELSKLPRHMRQPVVCEGTSARYRLRVRYAGKTVADQTVRGGGLRQDRRLYIFQEVPLSPGEASIEVSFERLESEGVRAPSVEGGHDPGAPERAGPPQLTGETVPARLSFEQRLRVRPREVILVTYAPERRQLIAVQDSGPTRH